MSKEEEFNEEEVLENAKAALETPVEEEEEVVEEEVDEVELKAREMGWRPEEEFEGETGTWVDAKEFVGRAPLYEAIHKANRTAKKAQKQAEALAEHNKKVEQAAYERALKTLKDQKQAAMEEEDLATALKLGDKIEELKEQKEAKEVDTTEKTFDEEVFADWRDKEAWFGKDDALTYAANGYGAELEAKGGLSQEEILKEVSVYVRKAFPEKFGVQRPTATPVEKGSARKRASSTKTKGTSYNDLPEEAKKIYNEVVKSDRNPGGHMTADEYLRQYDIITKG